MFRIVHNAETGEITQVELTEEEIADFNKRANEAAEAAKKEAEQLAAEQAAKEIARKAILEKLGISEEEAAVLLG